MSILVLIGSALIVVGGLLPHKRKPSPYLFATLGVVGAWLALAPSMVAAGAWVAFSFGGLLWGVFLGPEPMVISPRTVVFPLGKVDSYIETVVTPTRMGPALDRELWALEAARRDHAWHEANPDSHYLADG